MFLATTPALGQDSDCCVAGERTGCDTAPCATCVCEVDSACCETEWDVICTSLAAVECGESCPCEAPTPTVTPTPGGDCCTPHAGAQCDDDPCEACVCALDGVCCSAVWDQTCVEQAQDECLATCGCEVPTPTPTATPGGDCCSEHAGPGCDVPACQTCVCELDPVCCSEVWDATCAAEAALECQGACACEPGPTPTPTPQPTPGGDCCSEHPGPGCDVAPCQTCVCELDDVCCTEAWDGTCLDQAQRECFDACGCEPEPTPTPGGDCCSEHAGPGCDLGPCQACVCELDPVCCTDLWDGTCVSEAEQECLSECDCEIDLPCVGDCNGNDQVTIDELIRGVNIALGNRPLDDCPAFDSNRDDIVAVNELIQATNATLRGCT